MDLEQVIRELSALNDLSRSNPLQARDLAAALGRMTEVVARTLKTERVSIWRYNNAHTSISCVELYELPLTPAAVSDGKEMLIPA